MRLRNSSGQDELLTPDELGDRLGFRYAPTLEWASASLRSAYEAWGVKQEKELCEFLSTPSGDEIGMMLLRMRKSSFAAFSLLFHLKTPSLTTFLCNHLDEWVADNALLYQLYSERILAGDCVSHTEAYLALVNEKVGWGVFALKLLKAGTYIGIDRFGCLSPVTVLDLYLFWSSGQS